MAGFLSHRLMLVCCPRVEPDLGVFGGDRRAGGRAPNAGRFVESLEALPAPPPPHPPAQDCYPTLWGISWPPGQLKPKGNERSEGGGGSSIKVVISRNQTR